MNRLVSIGVLVLGLSSVAWIAAYAPRWINDENEFLHGFVNHELLAILGVILAITLASASQIHLKFNEMEEREGRRFLNKSRREVESNTYWLIASFVLAILIVTIKPLFVVHHFGIAMINGFSLWILLFDVFILYDITSGIFGLPPRFGIKPTDQPTAPPPTPVPPTPPERS